MLQLPLPRSIFGEGKVGLDSGKLHIGNDTYRDVGRERHDPVDNTASTSRLDGYRKIACEKRAVGIFVAQNFPWRISENRQATKNVANAKRLRIFAVHIE